VRSFLVIGVALALATPAAAQEPQARAARAVTLDEALAAVARAPERKVAALETEAARRRVSAAGAWPATSVGISTTLRTARVIPALSFPLPVFGTLSAERHAAQKELDVAQHGESGADLGLRRRVSAAWVDLFHAEASAELATRAAARQKELSDITAHRFEAGESPHSEVVAANAETQRAAADARAAQAAIAGASAELAGTLGWSLDVALHAQGALPETQLPDGLATLLAKTRAHPEVRAAQARVAASQAQVEVQRKRAWPQLSLEAEASIDDRTLPGSDFRAGLGMELPLFGRTSEAVNAAAAERDAARAQSDATQHAIAAQLVTAYRRCQAALERVRSLHDDVLPAQREAERLARAAYAEGQQGFTAVVQAERALIELEQASLDAQEELALAVIDLEWSSGGSR
jgi:cobalt-zinc-cadmium efflux system outer membrane protein